MAVGLLRLVWFDLIFGDLTCCLVALCCLLLTWRIADLGGLCS